MDFIQILEHHLLDHPVATLFTIGGHPVALTRHGVMMLIAGALIFLGLLLARRKTANGRTLWGTAVESFVVYVRDEVVRPNLGPDADRYLPYFLTLFSFILFCNLIGMVPWGATATGNVSVTAALAVSTFLMINFVGIRHHGVVHHFKNLVPHGLPFYLVPFMFVLELLGLFTKSFALCIRLFANMIAGHIVILAFISLIFMFRTIWLAPVSVAVAVVLSLLEVFVAFLQAYVFTLLTALFVGGSLNPEH
jgi:F-type H+-transporting ATPase subunit a